MIEYIILLAVLYCLYNRNYLSIERISKYEGGKNYHNLPNVFLGIGQYISPYNRKSTQDPGTSQNDIIPEDYKTHNTINSLFV